MGSGEWGLTIIQLFPFSCKATECSEIGEVATFALQCLTKAPTKGQLDICSYLCRGRPRRKAPASSEGGMGLWTEPLVPAWLTEVGALLLKK